MDSSTANETPTIGGAKIDQMASLWRPIDLGQIHLESRLGMAPMTRSRSTPEGVPTERNARYYAQRASIGLIISEGTQPSDDGQGYTLTPGIYTDAQVAGWRLVTDAVHAAGGTFVIQLMHVGRIAHPDNTPHGRQPVAPSAVRPAGQMFTAGGMKDMPEPRALLEAEVEQTVQDFRRAAAAAIRAGADGVEIHAANGYLPHQFLSSNANRRTDRYGGPIENRIRFALEIARAVSEEIGADRTGIRISPGNPFNDVREEDVPALYGALVAGLAPLGLAYLHVLHGGDEAQLQAIRRDWTGPLILNRTGADLEARVADLEAGLADVIALGVLPLANPDLVERLKTGAPLNAPDPSTFYGGDEHGYTDYPTLENAHD
jgi:N-ethylmaleimide reductase